MFSESQMDLGASHPQPGQMLPEEKSAPATALAPGLLRNTPASFPAEKAHGGGHDGLSDDDGYTEVCYRKSKKLKASNNSSSGPSTKVSSEPPNRASVLKHKAKTSDQSAPPSKPAMPPPAPQATVHIPSSSPLALLERTFSVKLPFEQGRLYVREQFLAVFRQREIDFEYIEAKDLRLNNKNNS